MANRWGRQAGGIIILITVGGVFVHVIAGLMGMDPVESTPFFGAVGAVGFGVAAIAMVAPRLALGALSCTIMAIVSASVPEVSAIASFANLACCAGAVALESGVRRKA